jgi:hypothetical protein
MKFFVTIILKFELDEKCTFLWRKEKCQKKHSLFACATPVRLLDKLSIGPAPPLRQDFPGTSCPERNPRHTIYVHS